jgi:polygalacturonase
MKKGIMRFVATVASLALMVPMLPKNVAKADAAGAAEASMVYNYITTLSSVSASTIQSAINKAYSAGGGVVVIPAGTYTLTSSIELKSNVTLEGKGKSQTVLKRSSSYNIPDGKGFVYSQGGLNNAVVKNLTIDGNADTSLRDSAPSNYIYGVLITDTNGYSNNKVRFSSFKIKNAHMGLHVKGTSNLVVKDSDFSFNGSYKLYGHNVYLRRVYKANLYNNYFNYSTSGNGVNISYCEDITIDSCYAHNNYFRGLRASDSARVDIMNCKVYNNIVGDGIILNSEVNGVNDFRVKRCTVTANGNYGILVNSACYLGQLWYNVDGGNNGKGYMSNSGNTVTIK